MTSGLIFHCYLFLLLQIFNTKPKLLRLGYRSGWSYLRVQTTWKTHNSSPSAHEFLFLQLSFLCICSSLKFFACSRFLTLFTLQSKVLVPLLYESSWDFPSGRVSLLGTPEPSALCSSYVSPYLTFSPKLLPAP